LQSHAIEPDRETKREDDETTAENQKHDRKLSGPGHPGQPVIHKCASARRISSNPLVFRRDEMVFL
jgi:hypothetical protein